MAALVPDSASSAPALAFGSDEAGEKAAFHPGPHAPTSLPSRHHALDDFPPFQSSSPHLDPPPPSDARSTSSSSPSPTSSLLPSDLARPYSTWSIRSCRLAYIFKPRRRSRSSDRELLRADSPIPLSEISRAPETHSLSASPRRCATSDREVERSPASMNCPSKVDPEAVPNGWNQNPNQYDLDTNNDSNGIANLRYRHDHIIPLENPSSLDKDIGGQQDGPAGEKLTVGGGGKGQVTTLTESRSSSDEESDLDGSPAPKKGWGSRIVAGIKKFARFVGPGFMVSVAYIDPGNYATDVAAGASYRFRLLVMILFSNIIAIFLQSLCIKLGSVTGMNLAENIRAHCPPWLNFVLWIFGESAIIATDMAEVIGTAIALNILLHIPIVAGCAISIADVLIILLFYSPNGSMRGLRIFELGVVGLVLAVFICFCVELSMISVPDVGELFRGYLPSKALVESKGLYQACGILGATVMPHSLFLGSGIVQPRLKEYDSKHGNLASPSEEDEVLKYKPSVAAIRSCLKMSIVELALSLFTFALFINSAILIVAGASLSGDDSVDSASLFDIHDLLSKTIGKGAGTTFALALLISGLSAGIVCTIAGQIVSEGQLNWKVKPWVRRLMTRSISILPSIVVAGSIGKQGLSSALEGSQVALSVILPFVSAPLIYFTCRNKYMTVADAAHPDGVKMKNNYITAGFAIAFWILIVVMNIALLVLVGMGKS